MIETTPRGSNPADDAENPNLFTRPRILLTGLRRSGKTSIQRVIFTKMQPSQTQFLESTPRLTTSQYSCGSFINFQVQELPGQLHVFSPSTSSSGAGGNDGQAVSQNDETTYHVGGGYDMERILKGCNAVVYIIDAQDDYNESILRLNMIIQIGRRVNQKIRYEVFIHKVDQLSEEGKIETQRDVHNQVRDRFADSIGGMDTWPSLANPNSQDVLINFHLTSIFDHSIFEAFSKVIQKLLPQFGQLEHLLNYLLAASNIEQAFLFDVQTKISIAKDSSPTDMQMYELCCDMIDLLLHMSEIYGQPNENGIENLHQVHDDDEEELVEQGLDQGYNNGGDDIDREPTDWIQPDDDEAHSNGGMTNGVHSLGSRSYSNNSRSTPRSAHLPSIETTSEPASNVFDAMSSSVIKLTGGRALYLKEVNRHLALICVLREEALSKQAIIDYNVRQLKDSILQLFQLNHQNPPTPENLSNIVG